MPWEILNNVDPLFVNPSQGDFHLQAGSPCIDAGIDVGLPYNGAAPDMGCYEYGTSAVNDLAEDIFDIYPNPANDYLQIHLNDQVQGVLEIQNLKGQTVLRQKLSQIDTSLDLQALPAGIYLLNIYGEKGNYSKKWIKK